ncbi:MAG: hypothetical protein ABRQ25_03655 [Clostridiaceae bacterium]
MTWDIIKEMNLYDKIADDLKGISEEDSKRVEEYITNGEKLQVFKEYVHQGYDNRRLGEEFGLTTNQVSIIKELLGKI